MLSTKLHDALNDQMNFEFYSAHVYMAMAAYCTSESYDGFANFFLVQAEEERFHAMKLYNYINDRGERAIITGFENPNNEYESVLSAFEIALEHEREVTKRIYNLSDIAWDEREHATITFLKWFVDEQVEEEASFDSIIQKLKRITSDSNALFMLDAELEKRTFTPPAE
ncbi:ferritin [Bacillus gaemokensis]|uniref:Ferritin n=1 Tax=Bacillus gaemokensis TaxID=574375 RepID=A0A073KFC9_9BACI|nr:ferritin [Bacillus gaemokensis]KEK25295.1 ferritin [Bacillus gaemokensis]KYG37261.1 ferritin [Bacillus gaemokensis]